MNGKGAQSNKSDPQFFETSPRKFRIKRTVTKNNKIYDDEATSLIDGK